MFVKKILKIIRAIFKPGKLCYYKLNNPTGRKFQDRLTAVLAFITIAYSLVIYYPYDGIGDFLLVILGTIISVAICIVAVSYIYPHAVKLVASFFYVPAMIYDACDDKINDVVRKKTSTTFSKNSPRAEVGIKYFIEREKRIQINHAKYIGPG